MSVKATYEKLQQRIKILEKDSIEHKDIENVLVVANVRIFGDGGM